MCDILPQLADGMTWRSVSRCRKARGAAHSCSVSASLQHQHHVSTSHQTSWSCGAHCRGCQASSTGVQARCGSSNEQAQQGHSTSTALPRSVTEASCAVSGSTDACACGDARRCCVDGHDSARNRFDGRLHPATCSCHLANLESDIVPLALWPCTPSSRWSGNCHRGKSLHCPLPADAPLRAVVIGAGLAGLATAKAMCGLFDEVTLVERDNVAAAPDSAEDATTDQVILGYTVTIEDGHRSLDDASSAAQAFQLASAAQDSMWCSA